MELLGAFGYHAILYSTLELLGAFGKYLVDALWPFGATSKFLIHGSLDPNPKGPEYPAVEYLWLRD